MLGIYEFVGNYWESHLYSQVNSANYIMPQHNQKKTVKKTHYKENREERQEKEVEYKHYEENKQE
jgi:hypothetical protein